MSLLQLAWLFFSSALVTFGGGYVMIPLLTNALVPESLSASEMANLVALAQMTPGAVGLNCATYIGYLHFHFFGALVCTVILTLPEMIIGTLASYGRQAVQNSRAYHACLQGIRPMVVGLITTVVLFFAEGAIFTHPLETLWREPGIFEINWRGAVIFFICLILELRLKLNVIWLISLAAVLGILLTLIR